MADLKPPQPPTSWYVPVPKPGSVDSQTQKTMNAIQENLERLAGIRSGGDFSLITATDMVDQTYIEGLAGQPQSVVNADVDPGQNPWGVSPPAPTSLNRVTHSNDGIAAPWYHHLEWTNPEDLTNVYYIEVWSSTIDDVGTASRIAIVTPPQNSVMVYGILMSVDYYYWVRSISYGYKKSLWEPNPDTVGGYLVLGIDTVGETIDNLMDILAGETPPAYDATLTYQIGDRVSYTTGSPSTTRKYVCTAETLNNLPTDTDYWDRTGILMTGEVDGTATVAIDGNLVVDGTIIARHISVSTLSAITADIGTITAGTLSSADWAAALGIRLDLSNKWLTMGGSGTVAAGTQAGIFLGYSADGYKFYVGDGASQYFKFDGTNVSISGTITASALEIGTSGYMRTAGKTTYADTDAGIWIGYDSAYKLNIGDATDYIKWSGTALTLACGTDGGLTIASGGGLTIASGGDLTVAQGGDITLTGGASGNPSILNIEEAAVPGELRFVKSTDANKYHVMKAVTSNSQLIIAPVGWGTTQVTAQFGGIAMGYTDIWMVVNTDHYSGNAFQVIYETAGSINATYGWKFTTGGLLGYGDPSLGSAGTHLSNAFAHAWNVVADLFYLDTVDDLAELHKIKGSGVIDLNTGLELIDDDTLPEWMLAKADKQEWSESRIRHPEAEYNTMEPELLYDVGDILYTSDGRPWLNTTLLISHLQGCIRQLDLRVKDEKIASDAEIVILKDEIIKLKGKEV